MYATYMSGGSARLWWRRLGNHHIVHRW